MLTFRLDQVLKRYPDAKLVYIIRDPVEVIPSGMSLASGVLENGYDVWNRTTEADQKRWVENLWASCEMLRSFHEAYHLRAYPREEPVRGPLYRSAAEPQPTMKRILDFIEIDRPASSRRSGEQGEKQATTEPPPAFAREVQPRP